MSHHPPLIDSVVVIRDSTITIYRDSIINVLIQGETTIDSVIIPCPEPPPSFIPDTAHLRTSFAEAFAWFKYPSIKLKLVQIDTTLQIKLEAAIRESQYWHYKYLKQSTIVEKKYIPGFYKFGTFAFIGICIVLILLIVLKKVLKI